MKFVGHGGDQGPKKISGDTRGCSQMQFHEREHAGAIDDDKHVELAFGGAKYRDIDVEIAGGI
jgi:hypothetical protein